MKPSATLFSVEQGRHVSLEGFNEELRKEQEEGFEIVELRQAGFGHSALLRKGIRLNEVVAADSAEVRIVELEMKT